MDEKKKRSMYIEEIFGKMILEADRRNSGDPVRDLYGVYVDLGILCSMMFDKVRKLERK